LGAIYGNGPKHLKLRNIRNIRNCGLKNGNTPKHTPKPKHLFFAVFRTPARDGKPVRSKVLMLETAQKRFNKHPSAASIEFFTLDFLSLN